MQVSLQTLTRTGNFPQWLASPTDKFYIIPVEEKLILCCQNLLEIILKMSKTGPVIFSSPALLSLCSILMSKTTNYSVSQAKYSGCVPGTSLSLSPHSQADASSGQFSLFSICGSHALWSSFPSNYWITPVVSQLISPSPVLLLPSSFFTPKPG